MAGLPTVRMPVDKSMGHGCFPPTNPMTGSTTTYANQFAEVRVTDKWVVHCCFTCHMPVTVQGSSSVFIDQLADQRQTDSMNCGDRAATGSNNVFAG